MAPALFSKQRKSNSRVGSTNKTMSYTVDAQLSSCNFQERRRERKNGNTAGDVIKWLVAESEINRMF